MQDGGTKPKPVGELKSAWGRHVRAWMDAHNVTYKAALTQAKASYKSAAKPKAAPRQRAAPKPRAAPRPRVVSVPRPTVAAARRDDYDVAYGNEPEEKKVVPRAVQIAIEAPRPVISENRVPKYMSARDRDAAALRMMMSGEGRKKKVRVGPKKQKSGKLLPWDEHVVEFRLKHPLMKLKEVLKEAALTYRKKPVGKIIVETKEMKSEEPLREEMVAVPDEITQAVVHVPAPRVVAQTAVHAPAMLMQTLPPITRGSGRVHVLAGRGRKVCGCGKRVCRCESKGCEGCPSCE